MLEVHNIGCHRKCICRIWPGCGKGASSVRVLVIVGVGESDEWFIVVDEVCKDGSSLIMVVRNVECVDVGGGVMMLS